MHSNGDRWRCPQCRKQVAKSGATHGGYRHGAEGGTSSTERSRASRKRTGKTGNEARDRKDEFHASLNPDLEWLKNTLLDAIERSHPNYAKAVSEALTEALDIPNDTPAMTAHEFGAWLTSL